MYSARLTKAFDFAARAHRAQTRKGVATPYLSHLLGVASLVIEFGGDEDDVIAALLHDAVEDCGGQAMADRIKAEFGDTVVRTVLECSDSVTDDPEVKAPWEDRKRTYVAAIAGKSARARLVTACDKLHNATAILSDQQHAVATGGDPVWGRFVGKPPEATVAYYSALLRALEPFVVPALARRLRTTVEGLEAMVDGHGHATWIRLLSQAA